MNMKRIALLCFTSLWIIALPVSLVAQNCTGEPFPEIEIRTILQDHDTLCRLISFSDTLYVTNAEAHLIRQRYQHPDCYTPSNQLLDKPLWILRVEGEICKQLTTRICDRAEYYDRSDGKWIPLTRVNTVGYPTFEIQQDQTRCQLIFKTDN